MSSNWAVGCSVEALVLLIHGALGLNPDSATTWLYDLGPVLHVANFISSVVRKLSFQG